MFRVLLITAIILRMLFFTNLSAQPNTWVRVTDKAGFSVRSCHQVLILKNRFILIGGHDAWWGPKKDAWTSENGKDWTLLNSNTGISPNSSAVFHDTLWAETGRDIWNSVDGKVWKKVISISNMPLYGKRMVAFNNKLWIIAGTNGAEDKNDVWYSDNGQVWKKISTSSCFSPRFDVSLTVFDNKLWVVGGCQVGAKNLNDVWNTADGINWEKVCDGPFIERHVSQTVVFQNKMWLIGGFTRTESNTDIILADIWVSSDGKNWQQNTSEAPFGRRQEHQVVVFNNKMWLIGGITGVFDRSNLILNNDIWVFSDEETSHSQLNDENHFIKVCSNPGTGRIEVLCTSQKAQEAMITVVGMNGKIKYSNNRMNLYPKAEISTDNFPPGIYIVSIRSDRAITSEKIVVN